MVTNRRAYPENILQGDEPTKVYNVNAAKYQLVPRYKQKIFPKGN
jgi:hypothetical protein